MTTDEAREAILLAILDCELEDARGETYEPRSGSWLVCPLGGVG